MSKNSTDISLRKTEYLNIIAIGASAGGLEALQSLLSNLPKYDSTCLIVAQHLSPTHKSLLVHLLSKYTQLPVFEAEDGLTLKADCIYITPPDKEITIIKGQIQLKKPTSTIGPKPSVDVFFASLASIQNQKVVAIVLSGTGSDGSLGLKEIRGSNFLKIAQDPATAKYDGMPKAASQIGHVDLVLSPEAIGETIQKFFTDPNFLKVQRSKSSLDKVTSFDKILKLLEIRTGSDFSNYKTPTLSRRLKKRMDVLHFDKMDTYLEFVQSHPEELDELFNIMLIGVTQFFRDKEAFSSLRIVLEEALIKKTPNESVRVWVPGCSTGEEAYSVAILVQEILGTSFGRINLQIFATDIDDRAIQFARRALYSSKSLEGLSDDIKERYFIKKGDNFEVIKRIRSKVLFSKHDVNQNPPFLRLDLITCRNLLIYFNAALQQQIIPLFHYALMDAGILFLGKSETIGNFSDLFSPIDAKYKIYRKKTGSNFRSYKFASLKPNVTQLSIPVEKKKQQYSLTDRIKETLYTDFDHPFVVINHDYEIVEVYGDVRLFYEFNHRFNSGKLVENGKS